ncbi:MAG: hydroxyacid dehydrogenase [Clostridia bacterium]|nr:hydroxyacid dehydrogenase [Clostridia bacterium]
MKLLVTGAWKNGNTQLNKIKEMGYSPVFMQNEKDELPCDPETVEGVVCNGLFLYHDIREFTSLKFIQLTSAGFDRVPMDYVQAQGIKVYNARGVYSVPMAEFAVCGVLQLYKQGRFFYENQQKHVWEKHRGLLELFGKTVAVVGCGNVGCECAKRFKAFGCNLVGVDLYDGESELFGKIYSIDKIDCVLKVADVVVLTLPLTDKTKDLFNEHRFSAMKDDSVLVNIARGAIVNEKALEKALNTKLFGAVIDVFENEPLMESSELWKLENVVLTPHNSFVGENNEERLASVIYKNLKG